MRGAFAAKSWPNPSLVLSPESSKYQDHTRTTLATVDGQSVGSWTNIGVSGLHPIQNTAAKKPLLKVGAGPNGYDCIRCDGVDDSLVGSMAAITAQTWFVVAKKNSAVAAALKTLLGIALSDAAKAILFCHTTYGAGYSYGVNQAGGFTSVAGVPTNWNVIAMSYASTASLNARMGGGVGTALDPNDAFPTYATYTLTANYLSSYGDFDITEVRRYDSLLSLDDLNLVGGHLGAKYGLTWATAA